MKGFMNSEFYNLNAVDYNINGVRSLTKRAFNIGFCPFDPQQIINKYPNEDLNESYWKGFHNKFKFEDDDE